MTEHELVQQPMEREPQDSTTRGAEGELADEELEQVAGGVPTEELYGNRYYSPR